MSLPRYADLVDSAAHLTARRPRSWREARLKSVLRQVTEKAEESDWKLALENIESWTGRLLDSSTELEGDGIEFRQGDVLFGKLRPYLAKALTAPRAGAAVGDFLVLRPQADLHPGFLRYLLVSPPVIDSLTATAEGAKMPRTSWSALSELIAPIPSFQEQVAITGFLDSETAKTDALIAEQERLIALLQEKRQGVISHAVTKGLDPNVPMKDSAVDWIGKVPDHWEVLPGRRIAAPFSTESVAEEHLSNNGAVMYLKVSSLVDDSMYVRESEWYAEPAAGMHTAPSDFIVFPKRGAAISLNRVNIVRSPALLDPNLMGWIPAQGVDIAYLAYTLKARRLVSLADVSTIPQLNNKHIDPALFPIPPLNEQHKIVAHLDTTLARLDALTQASDTMRTLLKERRTALITAAVTGQIDVRGLVETAA